MGNIITWEHPFHHVVLAKDEPHYTSDYAVNATPVYEWKWEHDLSFIKCFRDAYLSLMRFPHEPFKLMKNPKLCWYSLSNHLKAEKIDRLNEDQYRFLHNWVRNHF